MSRDPVCGMEVKPSQSTPTSQYGGQTYHFCSTGCKQKFDQNPQQYAKQPATQAQRK
jgi:Cu+-exporting ATPase